MRDPPENHWSDTLPAADRERYRVAWQAHRCCRDCRQWACDDDSVGVCTLFTQAAFLTPEDYTCDGFESK